MKGKKERTMKSKGERVETACIDDEMTMACHIHKADSLKNETTIWEVIKGVLFDPVLGCRFINILETYVPTQEDYDLMVQRKCPLMTYYGSDVVSFKRDVDMVIKDMLKKLGRPVPKVLKPYKKKIRPISDNITRLQGITKSDYHRPLRTR